MSFPKELQRIILICAVCLVAIQGPVSAASQRPLTPDDLFHLEEIGTVVMAPDGGAFAFVRVRPLLTARSYQHHQYWIGGGDRADIWIASIGGGAATNITKGESDGSGYWKPMWSPDGKRIAMLSTKGGGDNPRLWIWEKDTSRLSRLSERGIAFWTAAPGFAWVDNERLVAVLRPEEEKSPPSALDYITTVAVREWAKTKAGKQPAASVLDSGVPVDLASRPQEQVALIDVNGNTQVIESAALFRDISVAPDHHKVAFLKQVSRDQPDPAVLLQHRYGNQYESPLDWYQPEIVDSDGHIAVGATSRTISIYLPGSFRWAPDSHAFAFIGTVRDGGGDVFRVFRGTVGGSINPVKLDEEITPYSLVWADADRLLLLAERKVARSVSKKKRLDWWLLHLSRAPRNLTAKLAAVPGDLLTSSDGRTLLGTAGGDLWRLDIESEGWSNLTGSFEPKIAAIMWPRPDSAMSRATVHGDLVVSAANSTLTDFYSVDTESGAATQLKRPSDLAMLAAYRADDNVALFTANEPTGTYLTLVRGDGHRVVVETNQFLGDVSEGKTQQIEYRSLDGENLHGWILLPANYVAGKRYPLVAWVYPGWNVGETADSDMRLNRGFPTNLQLLAARGYAVLIPSMPSKVPDENNGEAGDPYMELMNGVLPAADKAIELGIADPNRLAVMGHSFGGYGTYSLITQTARFKAAIAIAGITDFISYYGIFVPPRRYGQFPHEFLLLQALCETSQLRMGNPPWKDMDRYVRNSPLSYVDRVETPLLMIHGDMDGVAITQAEEFFTALNRQGKRARFVRYWGEGHVLASPANIRDMWMQIYVWLDEFCDISRDAKGSFIFDGSNVKSRNGTPPLKPADFARFNEMSLKESQLKPLR